ncbi:MAG TPA: DUF2059 domain-containing protein [Devosia sp.]|jgi:hypothetical protein|nr:DUF2059 domain-containing protein [Devosia sp.]
MGDTNHMMMKSLSGIAAAAVVAFSLAFGAAAPATAQEIAPEQLALARKYVDLTNKAQIYEAISAMTAAQTSKLLSQSNPELSTQIDEQIAKSLEARRGQNDELFNQIARIYAVTYTAEELQQIVAFYETPAGQKLAENAMAVNQDVGRVMQIYASNFGTDFVREVRAALKAAGYNV